jgi:hypothetical protein
MESYSDGYSQNELQSYGAGGASKPTKGFTLSRRLLEREIGSYVGERGRILNQLMAQVSSLLRYSGTIILHGLTHNPYSQCFQAVKRTLSSIMTIAPILANFPKMGISFTAVLKISRYGCTIPQIHTNGNIISLWIILAEDGPSPMRLFLQITTT